MFGTVLITICTLMHVYVFLRAATVPGITRRLSRKMLFSIGMALWVVLVLGRVAGHDASGFFAHALEFMGMNYMAFLFLTFVILLAVDVVTLFGFLMPRLSPSLRGCAILVGLMLSVIALFQGLRPPVIRSYDVVIPGLTEKMDGTVMIALADTHLGSLIGEPWLDKRIDQVMAEKPDMVVLLGDIFEGHGSSRDDSSEDGLSENGLIEAFRSLSAPMGVWAVMGNHEFHGKGKPHLFEDAGIKLLRNDWVEIRPGFVLAGVDDLTTHRRRSRSGDPVSQTLKDCPPGATVFLSHTPWETEKAAKAGVNLMLCGHTHGGQIWPFSYLVRTQYPLLAGRYNVNGMTVIVSRGTGTWGPRMRLWHPGEILRVTLRAGEKKVVE